MILNKKILTKKSREKYRKIIKNSFQKCTRPQMFKSISNNNRSNNNIKLKKKLQPNLFQAKKNIKRIENDNIQF